MVEALQLHIRQQFEEAKIELLQCVEVIEDEFTGRITVATKDGASVELLYDVWYQSLVRQTSVSCALRNVYEECCGPCAYCLVARACVDIASWYL